MAISLTVAELKKVEASRRSEKPKYYNATSETEVRISDDFEAFLILQGKGVKNEAKEWLSKTLAMQDVNLLRDALLADALNAELADVNASLDEANNSLTNFNNFRERFSAGKFASVGEVQRILNGSQHGIDDLVNLRDRLSHQKALNGILLTEVLTQGLSEDLIKEIGSWLGPLAAY